MSLTLILQFFTFLSAPPLESPPPAFAPLSYTTAPLAATGSALIPLPAIDIGFAGTSSDGEPGSILTIHSLVSSTTDAKAVPLIALQVPEGSPPTPFLPVGPFEATFTGIMQFENAGEYTFYAEGRGEILVDVHEEIVLRGEAEDLSTLQPTPKHFEMGHHPYSIYYKSPNEGESRFRLYWESEGIPKEPVSPLFLSYYWPTKYLEKGQALRRGRTLFAEHRCHKCHELPFPLNEGEGMPEMDMDAPTLDGVAKKYSESWVHHFITDPRSYRDSATMPTGLANLAEARDIVAYLRTKSTPGDRTKAGDDPELVAKGETLFREQECQTCHQLAPIEAESELENLIDLKRISEKWNPNSLASFLMKPEENFAWTQMPNFALTREEAEALVAFLVNSVTQAERDNPATVVGDPERGKALLQEKRCLNCHTLEGMSDARMASPIAAWDLEGLNQGCLYDSPLGTESSLQHGFSEEDIEDLGVFIREGLQSLERIDASEFADRQIEALRCLNCHGDPRAVEEETIEDFTPFTQFFSQSVESWTEEEDFESEWEEEIEEATPTVSEHQTRPYLTWAGEKLRTEWTEALLAGTLPYKPRPLLPARMPSFPARAKLLAEGMAQLHSVPEKEPEPEGGSDLIPVGNLILGEEGFKCRSCHPIGDQPSLSGTQGASTNFDLVAERLRYPFFERLLRNPQRVLPGSPMPQYILPDGSTPLSASLELDTATQIQAMWQSLLALRSSGGLPRNHAPSR